MLIHGVIVDEQEAPLEWASVLFIDAPIPLPDIAAITDENGGFILTAPVPGRYRLRCQAPDHEPTELTVDVADRDVSVTCRLATPPPA
jgi:Carboxypeptidase regulatory-like domain